MGKRRQPYFFIFGLLAFTCYLLMATVVKTSAYSATATLFGASFAICFCNVLAEALIVEKGGAGKAQPQSNPQQVKDLISRLMSIYWGTEAFVKIFAGYFSGSLLEVVSKQTIFAVTSFFPLLLVVLAFAIKEEPRLKSEEGDAANDLTPSMQASRVIDAIKRKEIWGPMLFVFLLMIAPSSQSAFFFFFNQ